VSFLELAFDLSTLSADAAEAACWAQGASSVTFVDSRDDPVLEPLPGEFRLWPSTCVKALFEQPVDPDRLVRELGASLGIAPDHIRAHEVQDRVWEREWLKDFHPMRFGRRLWVYPHHEEAGAVDTDGGVKRVIVRMDPGLAFGTGTHPSTALCLEWLDANASSNGPPYTPGLPTLLTELREAGGGGTFGTQAALLRSGARVIDYGCGSGILAVAAVKLGAGAAHCFDIDPQALIATRDNAHANGINDRVYIHHSTDTLPAGADILLANILSGPLRDLAPSFASLVRPGGAVVLAGLMDHEVHEVTHAYDACFDMQPFGHRDGWIGLCGRRH
jgi:ribosomal protein L11 methyltransferase